MKKITSAPRQTYAMAARIPNVGHQEAARITKRSRIIRVKGSAYASMRAAG